MKLITKTLENDQFFRQLHTKTNIVLHHTVSQTAESAISWWGNTAERVGTAYVIGKDGTVFNCFPDSCWAWHLGLKHQRNGELNRRSIAIELVNEGPLWQHKDGSIRWLNPIGPKYLHTTAPDRVPVPNDPQWRYDCQYWAPYTQAQYDALNDLLPSLLSRYNLPGTMYTGRDYDAKLTIPDKYTIYSHCNVRADKSDLSPAFDFAKLNTAWQTPTGS